MKRNRYLEVYQAGLKTKREAEGRPLAGNLTRIALCRHLCSPDRPSTVFKFRVRACQIRIAEVIQYSLLVPVGQWGLYTGAYLANGKPFFSGTLPLVLWPAF